MRVSFRGLHSDVLFLVVGCIEFFIIRTDDVASIAHCCVSENLWNGVYQLEA